MKKTAALCLEQVAQSVRQFMFKIKGCSQRQSLLYPYAQVTGFPFFLGNFGPGAPSA